MIQETKHSVLPFLIKEKPNWIEIIDARDDRIFSIDADEYCAEVSKADAMFIVNACNSYYDLLRQAEWAVAVLKNKELNNQELVILEDLCKAVTKAGCAA